MTARDGKVEVRIEQLMTLRNGQRNGQLDAALKKAHEIWERGTKPQVVRVRRSFVVRETFADTVLDERQPLPREERPFSAQMITPKGLSLKLHLLLLFAAQCEAVPGKGWADPYPIEPTAQKPDSWMGLVATIAKYNGPGILASAVRTNKVRQIAQGLKTLEGMGLVQSATGVTGQVRRGIVLQCENGKSTPAASIPYTVPTDEESFLEIPVGFFTRGWVHVLTTSEIAALLMWFDILKFQGRQLKLTDDAEPTTLGFVNSHQRHSLYGLGRETYETHKQLSAFQLMDVHRPEKRYMDGKWQGYAEDSSDMACHRVSFVDGGFDRDAGDVILPVLRERDTTGKWNRPVQWGFRQPGS